LNPCPEKGGDDGEEEEGAEEVPEGIRVAASSPL
jgi:hypothetical protein